MGTQDTHTIRGQARLTGESIVMPDVGKVNEIIAAAIGVELSAAGSITAAIAQGVTDAGGQAAAKLVETLNLIAGDLLYVDAEGNLNRLAKGVDGQALKMVAGAPAWAADAVE